MVRVLFLCAHKNGNDERRQNCAQDDFRDEVRQSVRTGVGRRDAGAHGGADEEVTEEPRDAGQQRGDGHRPAGPDNLGVGTCGWLVFTVTGACLGRRVPTSALALVGLHRGGCRRR